MPLPARTAFSNWKMTSQPWLRQENRRHELRELQWHTDDDGCLVLTARFTPEQGALVRNAISAMMETLFEEQKNVSAETSRRLACDCSVINWLDHKGNSIAGVEALAVSRKTRTVPPALRRALQRRDRGCRFPGCRCSRFVDAHHIHHWADGGETHINNLVLLCRHHHRLVHEGGFGLMRSLDGDIQFTTPKGKPIPESGEKRFSGSVSSLTLENEELGIAISPQTSIPDWWGESMDSSIVVHNLTLRDQMKH